MECEPAPSIASQADIKREPLHLSESRRCRDGDPHPVALPRTAGQREQVVEALCGAPDAKRAWPELGMIQDISEQEAEITVPVRIIVGGADRIESETALRAAFGKVIPGAVFVLLPAVGHLAPLEATGEVVRAIRSAPFI
jgi:pimeloyl-ACP methyl ester carboxylesterase